MGFKTHKKTLDPVSKHGMTTMLSLLRALTIGGFYGRNYTGNTSGR